MMQGLISLRSLAIMHLNHGGQTLMSRRPKPDYQEEFFDKGCHAKDLRNFAIISLKMFFEDKSWFVGGPIPERELLSEESIMTVLRTPFDDTTFNFIHNECLSRIPQPKWFKDEGLAWPVVYLIKLLSTMKRLNLPKDFQPGLALLYFKFCKGHRVLPPPLL